MIGWCSRNAPALDPVYLVFSSVLPATPGRVLPVEALSLPSVLT